jgi:branched-chain amino acid transport system ATP-binding protein
MPRGDTGDDTVISIEELNVFYGKTQVIWDISLEIEENESVFVIGPNGVGKTTLFETVAGHHQNYEGSIRYRGSDIREMDPSEIVSRGLTYCSERRNLFGHLSVEKNLELGAYHNPDPEGEVAWVYDLFPKLAKRKDQLATTLSGGEQQMLAIGRGLMADPELIILDEPTLGLAPVIIEDIKAAIKEIQGSDLTFLIAEQNVTLAQELADRILLVENGRIVEEGTPETFQDVEFIQHSYLGEVEQ